MWVAWRDTTAYGHTQEFHAEAAARMMAAFEEKSRPFRSEKLHGLYATKLEVGPMKESTEHGHNTHKNSSTF